MKQADKIIAPGFPGRPAAQMGAVRARLRAEIRARYAAQLEQASLLRRVRLEWAIEREVRAGMAKICPPGALYATLGKTNPPDQPAGRAAGALH